MAYPGHPRGPLATQKYTSYARRYARSKTIGIGTTKSVNFLAWNDRNGASGEFCATPSQTINTTIEPLNEGVYAASTCDALGVPFNANLCPIYQSNINIGGYAGTVPNGETWTVIGSVGNCSPGTTISIQRNHLTSVHVGLCTVNGSSGNSFFYMTKSRSASSYKYTITDTVKTEEHTIQVTNPTENFSQKGYEWLHGKYLITSSGSPCDPNGFSCSCPDFTQTVKAGQHWLKGSLNEAPGASRSWAGSNAGPFNPCKHIMAVKRLLGIEQNYGGLI